MIGLAALAAAAAVQPQPVLTIDPKHRLVEGVASDGTTIWVSSLLDRQILACKTACRVMARIPAPLHPFAIAWDAQRKRLWVAADCPPGVAAIKPCDRGALIGLTAAGRMVTRIAPPSGSFHPGDVSTGGGDVYVSDGQSGIVYSLTTSGYGLRAVTRRSEGKSAQGTAFDDSQRLVVADYSQGLSLVDLVNGKRYALPRRSDLKPLRGIDGLARCGSVLYGIYNGRTPGALVAITTGEGDLTYQEILGGTALPDPTQIAFDGKRLLIVADSGWATLDKPDFERTEGTPIVAVPLSEDCRPL